MRSKLGKSLRKQFESRLRREYPGFSVMRREQGSLEFTWPVTDELKLYLSLQVSLKGDSFIVAVGHVRPGEEPHACRLWQNYDEAVSTSGRARFQFFKKGSPPEKWWWLDPTKAPPPFDPKKPFDLAYTVRPPMPEDDCLPLIPALLDDAFGELASFAVPFWKDVAQRRGVVLDLGSMQSSDP